MACSVCEHESLNREDTTINNEWTLHRPMGMLTLARFVSVSSGFAEQPTGKGKKRHGLYSLAERKASETSFLNVIHYLVKLDLSQLTVSLTFDLVIYMYMVLLHVNLCYINIKVNFYQLPCCRNLEFTRDLYIILPL